MGHQNKLSSINNRTGDKIMEDTVITTSFPRFTWCNILAEGVTVYADASLTWGNSAILAPVIPNIQNISTGTVRTSLATCTLVSLCQTLTRLADTWQVQYWLRNNGWIFYLTVWTNKQNKNNYHMIIFKITWIWRLGTQFSYD